MKRAMSNLITQGKMTIGEFHLTIKTKRSGAYAPLKINVKRINKL